MASNATKPHRQTDPVETDPAKVKVDPKEVEVDPKEIDPVKAEVALSRATRSTPPLSNSTRRKS